MTVSNQTVEVREEHLVASRAFAETFPRFLQCSQTIQSVVRDLVQQVNDPGIPEEERPQLLLALAATLFARDRRRPVDESRKRNGDEAIEQERVREQLDREESLFAANLKRVMKERNLTQAELAERVGLSQPAISMLLAQKYRPQRRTVRLIAQGLGVEPGDLWPGVSAQGSACASAGPEERPSVNGMAGGL
jgi:DNA-binding XRE family transcriptional regulator